MARLRGLLAAAGLASMQRRRPSRRSNRRPRRNCACSGSRRPSAGRRPVVVALHGCGGLRTSRGVIDARYVDYAARWNAAGWHVLLPDSFGARGKTSICREPSAERSVTVAMRRQDVNVALAVAHVAARRRSTAASRWSAGPTAVRPCCGRSIAPTGRSRRSAAIALYPSCAASLRNERYAPAVPLLLLVGALDDWTPPRPCEDLARRLASARRQPRSSCVSYADSYHGFDSSTAGAHAQGHPQRRGWPQRSRRWQPCRAGRRARTHRSVPQAAPRLACSSYTHCSSAARQSSHLYPPRPGHARNDHHHARHPYQPPRRRRLDGARNRTQRLQ